MVTVIVEKIISVIMGHDCNYDDVIVIKMNIRCNNLEDYSNQNHDSYSMVILIVVNMIMKLIEERVCLQDLSTLPPPLHCARVNSTQGKDL